MLKGLVRYSIFGLLLLNLFFSFTATKTYAATNARALNDSVFVYGTIVMDDDDESASSSGSSNTVYIILIIIVAIISIAVAAIFLFLKPDDKKNKGPAYAAPSMQPAPAQYGPSNGSISQDPYSQSHDPYAVSPNSYGTSQDDYVDASMQKTVCINPGIRSNGAVNTGYNARMIVGASGFFQGESFDISQGSVVIGRDARQCGVVYPNNTDGISGVHCEVYFDNGSNSVVLMDRGSSYGTFTGNGAKLQQGMQCYLGVGEEFYLATPENKFIVQ